MGVKCDLEHQYDGREIIESEVKNVNLKIDATDLDSKIKKIEELIQKMDELSEVASGLAFVTPEKLAKIAGCSENAARQIFNMPGFPCCDKARPQIAEVSAVREFFKQRHCTNK